MVRAKAGRLLVSLAVATIGLLAAGLALGVGAAPALAAKASPDFALSVNFSSPTFFVGHLVRGAVPGTPCGSCNGGALAQPAYFVPDVFGAFFDTNSIGVVSLNDFQGPVTLQILNLPAGVTSLTATPVTVPRRGAVTTPFKLQADSAAALGNFTVTLRATSGALVHTVDLRIVVADQPDLIISPASVVGGNEAQGGVLTEALAAGGTIDLFSSNPSVAQVPAGVTVPAGSSSGVFPVTTFSVTAPVTVTITASLFGSTSSVFLTVTPAPPPPPPPSTTITITRAEYDTAKQVLRVEATSTSTVATLQVFQTPPSDANFIGTLTNLGGGKYQGQLSWPVNPMKITVQALVNGSLVGEATSSVVAK